MTARRTLLHFATAKDKALYLHRAAEADALQPVVRDLAGAIAASLPPSEPRTLATALHRYVRDRIRYVGDGVKEEFADAATVLTRGYDDCDGKARLFVALCRAVKLEARILPVYTQGAFTHVAAQVKLDGRWTRAELILKGVELGQGLEHAQRDARGRPVLA